MGLRVRISIAFWPIFLFRGLLTYLYALVKKGLRAVFEYNVLAHTSEYLLLAFFGVACGAEQSDSDPRWELVAA
jgi:hypothetical protein